MGAPVLFVFAAAGATFAAYAAGCGSDVFTTTTTSTGTGGAAVSTSSTSATSTSSTSTTTAGGGPLCGNGTIDPGEQCDDGNNFDFDGCDSACGYEAVMRMTSVAIMGTPAPAGCTPTTNALGTKVISDATVLAQLNTPIQQGVDDGSINVLMQFLGLSDLTGANASGLQLGMLNGAYDPAKGTWPGPGPIDWWFLADHSSISMGLPKGAFTTASITNYALGAGPDDVALTLDFGGGPAVLQMHEAHLSATITTNSPPNVPAPPPGMLAAGLTVFRKLTANSNGQGLCGNITVASLAQIPAPQQLTTASPITLSICQACPNSHSYTYCGAGKPVSASCNSLLDVIVGGCGLIKVGNTCTTAAVNPTQPDVAANGTVQTLSVGGPFNKVTQNVTADADAYSAYLQFAANRAHFTGQTCAVTADCQAGKTCPAGGGVCQ